MLIPFFFGKLAACNVQHSGDNLTGAGSGDDETITVNLERIQGNIHQIFFVINIYTAGRSFAQVANPYCRLLTADGEEFCNYKLREAGREQGLMMARMFKEPGGVRWGFQAVGMPCKGNMWKDSLPFAMSLAQKPARDLQPPTDTRGTRQSGLNRSATDQVVDASGACGMKKNVCAVQ